MTDLVRNVSDRGTRPGPRNQRYAGTGKRVTQRVNIPDNIMSNLNCEPPRLAEAAGDISKTL